MEFSDYIIYADESGDARLRASDPFPVFTLVFCLFSRDEYVSRAVPAFQQLKFDYFGHDAVILHEREITRREAPFVFLADVQRRGVFLNRLAHTISSLKFDIIATTIRKDRLIATKRDTGDIYAIGLAACMKQTKRLLQRRGASDGRTHIVIEGRMPKQNSRLQHEFDRIRDSEHDLDFGLVIADKRMNSTGMQLADLVARPISLNVMHPDQPNRAFDVIESKLATGIQIIP